MSYFTANTLEELNRRDFGHLENSISAGLASSGLLQNSSQPVNIPNSQISNSISGKFIQMEHYFHVQYWEYYTYICRSSPRYIGASEHSRQHAE